MATLCVLWAHMSLVGATKPTDGKAQAWVLGFSAGQKPTPHPVPQATPPGCSGCFANALNCRKYSNDFEKVPLFV